MKNLSTESTNKLFSWLPHNLEAEEIVILPDACPGKSPLPTGITVKTRQKDWRKFAVSDVGCGMRLLKSNLNEINPEQWEEVANLLKANKGQLGDLGSGNHFLDVLLPYSKDNLHFLIHTGSRNESGLVDEYVDKPNKFDEVFANVLRWAKANRGEVQNVLEKVFGSMELILDLAHNSFEKQDDGSVIIRKGTVKVNPGELNIIPSKLDDDVALVKATDRIGELLNSLSHGTGRIVSRSESKILSQNYNFSELRNHILMPSCIQDSSLRTEGPYAYRGLDECLELLDGYIEQVERYTIVGYMGHL